MNRCAIWTLTLAPFSMLLRPFLNDLLIFLDYKREYRELHLILQLHISCITCPFTSNFSILFSIVPVPVKNAPGLECSWCHVTQVHSNSRFLVFSPYSYSALLSGPQKEGTASFCMFYTMSSESLSFPNVLFSRTSLQAPQAHPIFHFATNLTSCRFLALFFSTLFLFYPIAADWSRSFVNFTKLREKRNKKVFVEIDPFPWDLSPYLHRILRFSQPLSDLLLSNIIHTLRTFFISCLRQEAVFFSSRGFISAWNSGNRVPIPTSVLPRFGAWSPTPASLVARPPFLTSRSHVPDSILACL